MQTQTITLDVLKPIGTITDLSDCFNARVGDQMTPLQLYITQNGMAKDLSGYHPELEGEVGNGAKNGNDVEMAPGAKGVHWVGSSKCVTGYNQLTLAFPAEVFPQSGFCYGHLLLINSDGVRESSVDVWFQVLDGTPLMGLVADHYDSKLQLELIKAQNMNKQFAEEMKKTCQKTLSNVQASLLKNKDMLDQLSLSVGHVQSLINAGDVVPHTEYQKNKEATDAQVNANTRALQSHDAQLKQLTVSPSSDGTTEIADARIGSSELSSKTYSTLGEAIRSQIGGLTDAMKAALHEQPILPDKWLDNTVYNKDQKLSSTSGSLLYFNVYGLPLVRIRTSANSYINFYTLLDSNGNVVDYQRNDDSKAAATVDVAVAISSNAYTLVVSGAPGKGNSSKVHVTTYTGDWQVDKIYQGSIKANEMDPYIEGGMNRATLCLDTSKCEAIVTADSLYQIWDDHLGSWVSEVLVKQNDDVNFVLLKRSDEANFAFSDAYDHIKTVKYPVKPLILKSTKNGLSDISDRFKLQYSNIFTNSTSNTYYYYDKNVSAGTRIASQFITVDRPQSWLIDCDDGYEADLVPALPDGKGNYLHHDFYNSAKLFQTPLGWKGGHDYVNIYPQGAYALIFRAADNKSRITIADLWNHVRVYQVDNLVHLPSYYVDHIKDRVATINEKLTSPDDFGFGFITDVHAEFNTKHFPALIDEVRTKTPVNEFLGGGDWATAWFDAENDADQKPELFTFFEDLRRLFKGVPLLKTVGNHEWAYGANNGYNITSQEMYAYYLRDEDKMFTDIKWGPDHTYYYWDNQQAKCRYISLNVMDYPDTIKPTGNQDNKEWFFKVGDDQINWLKSTLNSVPDGYVVAIESHLVPLNADQFASFPANRVGTTITNGEDLQAIASAYAAKTGDFTGAKGDLLGWFGGHYHADDITVRNGVTYITTIADCMSVWDIPEVPKKTVGTISEQAFDVATVDRAARKVSLIRVGDGSDRSFTY